MSVVGQKVEVGTRHGRTEQSREITHGNEGQFTERSAAPHIRLIARMQPSDGSKKKNPR
jgi:hypothetical protein